MVSHTLNASKAHPAFKWLRSERIESLDITVEEYQHIKTGAPHYHLIAENTENVFLVALRTIPTDSTGVAHMLEHTVLCGSEKYQVRDPFFMMIRRSLNTFMNAFTSSDWTAYPFASLNRKDFNNLMDVYLDAVFFSRLDELDFAQEGHRFEFETPEDTSTDLVYKGVVFNEMKGAMSSPVSTLWQALSAQLFPTTTYHYNSGGDPEHIPDLSYKDLKSFYKIHYHPSNAVFMTFGDIPACEHQQKFEDQVLHRFDKLDCEIKVDDEQRLASPWAVEDVYVLDEEDTTNKTHVVLGWLLGRSTSLKEMLRMHLMSSVLLDNSASPLRFALETSEFGAAPSPLCGLEDSNREMSFMCGLEGAESVNSEAIEKLIIDVLERVVKQGIPKENVEAVLHQLELSQREIGGDGYPFGLQLILGGLSAAIHRGDPVATMNIDPILEELRADIQNPDFIKNLIKTNLLDNKHRVRLTMRPDKELSKKREQQEKEKLATIKAALTDEQKSNIIDQAKALELRQNEQDDPGVLPKVGLEDVPDKLSIPQARIQTIGSAHATIYEEGTNGLIYQQVVIEMPEIEDDLIDILPYYTYCLSELGCGDKNYLQTQEWQSSVSGGISSYMTVRGNVDDVQKVKSYFVLSAKALDRNHQSLNELMKQTLESVRFDELDRIHELISQNRARREQSITGNGHSFAMTAASSGMSPAAFFSHRISGLAGIKFIKQLDDSLTDENNISKLAGQFRLIHNKILSAPRQYLSVIESDNSKAYEEDINAFWQSPFNESGLNGFKLPPIQQQIKQAWITSTQVNFCSKSYPTVPTEHDDAAALTVLGGFLRNGYLHRVIREQGGAYGGGASHEPGIASFKFYSYRDPRLLETLNDFDKSIQWLVDENHDPRHLEEAILGVIGSLDKPGSPAGDAKQAFHNNLYGRSTEQRQHFRSQILKVKMDDLKRVGKKYLLPEKASVAVITHAAMESVVKDIGLEVIYL